MYQTITIKTFTTMLVKFNNEKDLFTWIKDHLTNTATIIDGDKEISNPDNYPCVMTYNFIENPVLNCEEDEEQYYDLIAQGYEEHEIDKLYYDFVYPYDFDSNHQ